MTAPELTEHEPQTTSGSSWLNRPLWTEWVLWVALAFGAGGLAGRYDMTGSIDAATVAGGLLVTAATFPLGLGLRRWLRPRLKSGLRRGMKLTVCILAGMSAFGGVLGVVQEQSGRSVSQDTVQAVVEILEKDGADTDHVAQDLAKQLETGELTHAQAKQLADAARRSPSGRYIAAASTAEREGTFQLNLANHIPGKFQDEKAALEAGRRVCRDLPGPRRSEFAFLLDLGPAVSEQDAGAFTALAVRMLCPDRLEENWLK